MNRIAASIAAFAAIVSIGLGHGQSPAQTPESASQLLARAQQSAAQSKRNVMVLFHASWCGWCHKMEGVMVQPQIKPIFDKYFVVQWLVTMENGEKKALENAGADSVMAAAGGKGTGIPFFYFTDSNGKLIVNSIRPAKDADKGGNVGCPYAPEEIAWFLEMLKKAAPKMTAAESALVKSAFEALSKKGG